MKTILAVIMMALSATAYGQLVKCVSKDGKVEYTTDCPAGTTETKIRSSTGGPAGGAAPSAPPAQKGGAAPSAPPAQKTMAERDAEFKKRSIEQQEAQQKDAKKTAEAEQKKEACSNAQTYLKTLESGMRITRTDPKTGERVFLDDSERASEMTRAQGRVTQYCG